VASQATASPFWCAVEMAEARPEWTWAGVSMAMPEWRYSSLYQGKTSGSSRSAAPWLAKRPGKPVDNAHIESFNRRLRDECLNSK
jgi:transposase InsO family protein